MRIIGLDVGFAAKRRTSGVAYFDSKSGLKLGVATSEWQSRQEVLGAVKAVDIAAIDAPLVPSPRHGARDCERIFSFGLFQRRCKPGSSHVRGTGRKLRRAGGDAAEHLRSVTSSTPWTNRFPRVWHGKNILEAFPNTFLGVCLEESVYGKMPKLRRGAKFDWLYDRWLECGLFSVTLRALGIRDSRLRDACQQNQNHDERAALVCLLTALAVRGGIYTAVGEPRGGYFFLPPWKLWNKWARLEVDRQRARLPAIEVWIDGRRYSVDDRLPEVLDTPRKATSSDGARRGPRQALRGSARGRYTLSDGSGGCSSAT